MKIVLIGQDIPALLPSLLADLYYEGKQAADLCVEERNPAMQDLLRRYGSEVMRHAGAAGSLTVDGDRRALLQGADCVIYAGDCMLSSRFHQDRAALSAPEPAEGQEDEEDPGLTDQARVNGGIGGLMHTLRQGSNVYDLIELMREACPNALVITLGQPVGRTCAMFDRAGFRCYGLAPSPLRGPGGLDGICKKLHAKPADVEALIAGLPGFAWLLKLEDLTNGDDLLPIAEDAADAGELGILARRWLDWYGALPVGDVTQHAEWLPAQEGYSPDPDPQLGESVERRKERILWMNTVCEHGLKSAAPRMQAGEGTMAQMLLLSRAPAIRPMQLALAVLKGADLEMPAVTRRNRTGELSGLSRDAIIEAPLTLKSGVEEPHRLKLPGALCDICSEVDQANRLAAAAAAGDRSALRELIETDPALDGLDRLYLHQLVDALIRLNSDVLDRLTDDEEDEDL